MAESLGFNLPVEPAPSAGFLGEPTHGEPMKNKYHKNGDVTFWAVYRQGWQRLHASRISDQLLATMNDKERARIARHAGGTNA